MSRWVFAWIGVLALNLGLAAPKVVNVYQWSGCLPESVLRQFTRETGIRVNSNHYDSNEALYTKLKAMPRHGYDVIMPSSYAVHRMIQENMLEPLDQSRLLYIQHIDPALLNKRYDPKNAYSLPYLFSGSGLVVHQSHYDPDSLRTWNAIWESRFKNKLLVLDDARELFAIALLVLGSSINAQNPREISMAYHKLQQLLPNVRAFNSEGLLDLYATEEITAGMGWSGDMYKASQLNPNLVFIYPKEGYILSIDSLAIPKHAQHLEAAYQLINFLSRPDIAATISRETGYGTASLTARHYLPEAMHSNPTIYPDEATLARGMIPLSVGETVMLYEKYWEQLKIQG